MPRILVTGASRGIGLELTNQYLQAGWQVHACYRSSVSASALFALTASSQPVGKLALHQLDVSQEADIQKLASELSGIPLDILFNNAGVWGPVQTGLGSVKQQDFVDVLKINTIAPLLLSQALLENVAQSDSKIIANMSSGLGSISRNSYGGDYIYRASKSALNALTKNLAIDLKNRQIIVVSIDPGWVKTDMGGASAPVTPQASVNGIRKILAQLALSDSGSFINYMGTKNAW